MNILRLAWMEVRLVLVDRMSFFWMLVLPLLMIYFFAMAFPQGQDPSKTKVALEVCNRDKGFLSRSLVESLEEENFSVVLLEDLEQRKKMKWLRTLIIPEEFTDRVLEGEKVELTLEIAPRASATSLEAAKVNVFKAVGRMIGNLCLMEAEEGRTKSAPGESAQARYKRVASLEPRVVLDASFAGKGKVIPGGYNQTVPGIIVMSILFGVMTYGAAQFVEDRKGGMLRRLAAAPCLGGEILTGKLLGRLFVGLLQTGILLFICVAFLGFYLGHSLLGWVLCLLPYIFACGALGMLLGSLFRSADNAATVGWISALVMAALGGCWWPKEVVPKYLNTAAYIFPTAWAMDALHNLISFGGGIRSVVPQAAVLTGFFLLFMCLCIRVFRYE